VHENLKRIIHASLPPAAVHALKTSRAAIKVRGARRAFDAASGSDEQLAPARLIDLQRRYPEALPYRYDDEALVQRGLERKNQLAHFFTIEGSRTLELAGHDAMVSGLLARDGAKATVIDLSVDHVDPRAINFGAAAEAVNAENLPYESGSFDCVFSYNAFEHFSKPEVVLAEALRVTRPGGILFFSFGPLYRSSYGLHAMHSITVPFCQFLWGRPILDAYIEERGLRRIEYETLNEWTIQQFRDLWARWQPWGSTAVCREVPSVHGIDLVRDFPSCFRGKVDRFEDLVVSIIEIAMRRTDKPMPLINKVAQPVPASPATTCRPMNPLAPSTNIDCFIGIPNMAGATVK
jgi:SAM-dependent methyltransferase